MKTQTTINCDQCQALMINGTFCHETGCPNQGAKWIDGEWVKFWECRECGDSIPVGDECNCYHGGTDQEEEGEE